MDDEEIIYDINDSTTYPHVIEIEGLAGLMTYSRTDRRGNVLDYAIRLIDEQKGKLTICEKKLAELGFTTKVTVEEDDRFDKPVTIIAISGDFKKLLKRSKALSPAVSPREGR